MISHNKVGTGETGVVAHGNVGDGIEVDGVTVGLGSNTVDFNLLGPIFIH